MIAARTARYVPLICAALLAGACASPPVEPRVPDEPEPKQPEQPAVTVGQQLPDTSQLLVLPNGLNAFATMASSGTSAQIQLGVLAGSLFEAPGLAELTAEVLIKSSDPRIGQRSLDQEIRRIGGTITAEVGLMTTWIDIRVPANKLRPALIALRTALDSVSKSRNQIARMRDELVASRSRRIAADPAAAMSSLSLLAEPGTADYVNGLLDLDPSQVELFYTRLYRPERCTLTVRAANHPRVIAKVLQEPADKAIAGWTAPPALPGDVQLIPRQFRKVLYWSKTDLPPEQTDVEIVLPLPQSDATSAAPLLVLHACLTLDGTGGRFERMQDDAGIGHLRWQARHEQTPDSRALIMSTTCKPAEAVRIWQVLKNARQSLVDVPPSASELQLALRRAELSAGLAALDEHARLREISRAAMAGRPVDLVERRLRELAAPGSWDVATAAANYAQQPCWMVVHGPARPDMADVVPFEVLPTGHRVEHGTSEPTVRAVADDPWIDRARAASGSPEAFAELLGFEAKATQQPELAPVIEDSISWRLDGTLTRERTVVDQTITTTLSGNVWSEQFGDLRKSLTADEADELRREMLRHPLMLLAAEARGELVFRPIAQRQVADREFMVMETSDARFDRLRLHIDTESHLIRVVESWERLGESIVHIRESWSDYRKVGELRAPHVRNSSWNDGQHSCRTTFTAWTPATP